MNHIEKLVAFYDTRGPETKDNLACIEFYNPKNKENTYGISFKFLGGDLQEPRNWQYHNSYYFDHTINKDNKALEIYLMT